MIAQLARVAATQASAPRCPPYNSQTLAGNSDAQNPIRLQLARGPAGSGAVGTLVIGPDTVVCPTRFVPKLIYLRLYLPPGIETRSWWQNVGLFTKEI